MSVLCQSMSRGAAVLAAALFLSSQAMGAGILRYATIGEPPSLDVQMGTATIVAPSASTCSRRSMRSTRQYKPQPMLATGEKIEDGGKTLVIAPAPGREVPQRQGDDRRGRRGLAQALGRIRRARQAADEERDVAASDRQIRGHAQAVGAEWRVEEHAGLSRGWRRRSIRPRIVSKAGNKPIEQKDYIGTGPYKFERMAPEPIRRSRALRRLLQAANEPGDGYAGARVANFDAIRFIPVPDVGTRVSGVQAGDYDYAELISGDLYD